MCPSEERASEDTCGPANLFPTQNTPEFDQNQWSFWIDQVLSSRQRLSELGAKYAAALLDAGGIWDANDPIGGPLSTVAAAIDPTSWRLGGVSWPSGVRQSIERPEPNTVLAIFEDVDKK